MVVLPSGTGIPVAIHVLVPHAIPVAPLEVCQVTCVMPPMPPDALPLTDVSAVVTVLTASTGETIDRVNGSDPILVGFWRVIDADCVDT